MAARVQHLCWGAIWGSCKTYYRAVIIPESLFLCIEFQACRPMYDITSSLVCFVRQKEFKWMLCSGGFTVVF